MTSIATAIMSMWGTPMDTCPAEERGLDAHDESVITSASSSTTSGQWFRCLMFLSQLQYVRVREAHHGMRESTFSVEIFLEDSDGKQPTFQVTKDFSDFAELRDDILDIAHNLGLYPACPDRTQCPTHDPDCTYCCRFTTDCAELEASWPSRLELLFLSGSKRRELVEAMLTELVCLAQSQLKYDDVAGPCEGQQHLPLVLAEFLLRDVKHDI